MNQKYRAGIRFPLFFLLYFFIHCTSVSQMQDKFNLGDTVTIYGHINSDNYLSKSDDSDTEYFNTAYNLQLNKAIEVIDPENQGKIFRNISHVEIDDEYRYDIYRFVGKEATIRGILKTFTEQNGYYRQYSTPLQISVINIKIEGNDCKGGKADAAKEIAEKKISLVIFGPKRYDGAFTDFFSGYLQKKYGIKLVIYGCEVDEYIVCYEKEMVIELSKKFGGNYLEKLENEAKREYSKK